MCTKICRTFASVNDLQLKIGMKLVKSFTKMIEKQMGQSLYFNRVADLNHGPQVCS